MTENKRAQETLIEALSTATQLKRMSWIILFTAILAILVLAFSSGHAARSAEASTSPLVRTTLLAFLAFASGAFVLILRALSLGLRLLSQSVESSEKIQTRLEDRLPELGYIVAPAAGSSPMQPPLDQQLAQCRQAIRVGAWDDAFSLMQSSGQAYPGHLEIAKLDAEFREARRTASRDCLAKIQAARDINDSGRVIELRAELKPLIDAAELLIFDRDIAKWFLSVIHRRLRVGTVSPDLVALAVKVADTLDSTLEGSSLRASLPTLRRAAGLCARCGRIYAGVSDTCQSCLSASKESGKASFAEDDG